MIDNCTAELYCAGQCFGNMMLNADLFKKVGELRDQVAVMQNGGPIL